jgi:hypothetical protein
MKADQNRAQRHEAEGTMLSSPVTTGVVAGHGVLAPSIATGLLALFAGCWRHLSGDYGPHFALTSALLLFIALSLLSPASARYGNIFGCRYLPMPVPSNPCVGPNKMTFPAAFACPGFAALNNRGVAEKPHMGVSEMIR